MQKLSYEDGYKILMDAISPQGYETISTLNAHNRVLYEDIISPENVPPFRKSPFDGYAFIASDSKNASEISPVELEISEEIAAGDNWNIPISSGYAAKILTGAPVPEGADVVVKYEETDFDKERVFIKREYTPGNICPIGEDVSVGEKIARSGDRISPAYVGILAGLGITEIKVYKKPRCTLISTGSELLSIEDELKPGKIRNSSVYTLKSHLKTQGFECDLAGIVEDDADKISEKIISEFETHDVVITTGGVSVGDYDLIPEIAKNIGADILFWKLKMKPGGSVLAAKYDDKLLIGLSGNPAAAFVSLLTLVLPALKKLGGDGNYQTELIDAHLLYDFKKKSPVLRFVPSKALFKDGRINADLTSNSGNGMLSPLFSCDCIAVIPPGSVDIKKGDIIKIFFL